MATKEDIAHELTREYFAEQPDLVRVVWLPTKRETVLCLLLVFRDERAEQCPLKLHSRFNDYECWIASVNESGWQDLLAGVTQLWEHWDLEGHQVIMRNI